jgi:hypothetical protein
MKKTMYKPSRPTPSTIVVNDGTEGETIEQKMNRIVNNKESIRKTKTIKPLIPGRIKRQSRAYSGTSN